MDDFTFTVEECEKSFTKQFKKIDAMQIEEYKALTLMLNFNLE
jgi:hypothetical protein